VPSAQAARYADLEEASNGREALERLAARPFDLVLVLCYVGAAAAA
jgi:CheY-like chemotaxis protein